MPFKSEKQRKFMYAKHPAIAKRWSKEEKMMKNPMPMKKHMMPKKEMDKMMKSKTQPGYKKKR